MSPESDSSASDREALEAQYSDWMQAAQSGDADAYRQLLNAIQPKVRAIVRAKIQESAAADDVVQNALLSIHRGRATYRSERPFGPWMRAVVRNSIIDHFRERKRRGERETELPVEEWADESETAAGEGEPLAPELAAALDALPPGQREAVVLIQIEGLSVAEAALKANVSPGALKVRAHRGYRALRKMLEADRSGGEWRSERPVRSGDPPNPEAGTETGAAGRGNVGPGDSGKQAAVRSKS